MRLRIVEAQGSTDVLRQHLAKLTALSAEDIQAVPESIPAFPALSQDEDLASQAEKNNLAVEAAEERARAQYLRARGEHRSLWPTSISRSSTTW